MYSRMLTICLTTMLIASCAKASPAPVLIDTGSLWVWIIYLTKCDIDVLDEQTKRNILAQDKALQASCQKSKEVRSK